jgi:hypothetical protein
MADGNDEGVTVITTHQPDGSVDVTSVHDNGAVAIITNNGGSITEMHIVPGEFLEQIDSNGNVSTYDVETGTFTPEGSEANWY